MPDTPQLELTIEKLVYGGDGLARLAPEAAPEGEPPRRKTVFMPFVLAGERVAAEIVEEKPGFARARAQQVLEASAARVAPECPYFLRCGGCHYQHAGYEHQLAAKAEILRETVARIAKVELPAEIETHAAQPYGYRNRTRLRVRAEPEFALGYFRMGTHELLPVEQCPISSPLVNRAIAALWELGRAGRVPALVRAVELFADHDDSRLLAALYCGEAAEAAAGHAELAQALREALPACSGVAWFSGVPAEGPPPAEPAATYGAPALTYATGHGRFQVSAGAFFQVNRFLTDRLIEIVTAGQEGATALDLYAGVGLFSLPLAAKFARVVAVEAGPVAWKDLRHNAPANVKTVRSTVQQYLERGGVRQPGLIVLDPPRAGLGRGAARAIAAMDAQRITYVACDPATLARDLRPLLESGYRVDQAHLVDLFPQTFHIESVLHLRR